MNPTSENPRQSQGSAFSKHGFKFVCAADVEPRRIDWLWERRLPAGKLVLMSGIGGVGKSTVLTDLAARLTSGRAMPDESDGRDPCAVILLASEECPDVDFLPRFIRMGGDRSRLYWNHDDSAPWVSTGKGAAEFLEELIKATGARLVIIDALKDHTAGSDKEGSDVRAALRPLVEVAKRTGATIVGLRHWRKGAGGAEERGAGSVEYRNVARMELMVGKGDDGRHHLVVEKGWGPKPPSLGFSVDFDDKGVPAVRWTGATGVEANDLTHRESKPKGSKVQAAMDAIVSELEGGPKLASAVKDAVSRKLKCSIRTIEDAATRLRNIGKLDDDRDGFQGPYSWRIVDPDPSLADSQPPYTSPGCGPGKSVRSGPRGPAGASSQTPESCVPGQSTLFEPESGQNGPSQPEERHG